MQAGNFIQSTGALRGTYFENALIFLTECNDAGAVGFIVNRPFGRSLHELEAYKHSVPFPLDEGGPVGGEQLFLLHRRPDLIEGGERVAAGIYFGGNMEQAVAAINNDSLGKQDLKMLIGYCGWDAGELEAEIAEGSWREVRGGWEDIVDH